jgi:hypothetical protein
MPNALSSDEFGQYASEEICVADDELRHCHRSDGMWCSCGRPRPCPAAVRLRQRKAYFKLQLERVRPPAFPGLTQHRCSTTMAGCATSRNYHDKGQTMRLTFVGKDPDSNPTGSPTVYRTDRGSWVVQGWVISDQDALAQMDIPEGETAVEIPDRMLQFFREDHGVGN